MTTITTPNGTTVRTRSQRRYAVVHEWSVGEGVYRADVVLRTDNPATARARRAGRTQSYFIFDTREGVFVP